MKRMLTMSVLAMAAVTGSATADPVTATDLLNAQDNAKEWLTYGRDYRNWRYSRCRRSLLKTPRSSRPYLRCPPAASSADFRWRTMR